MWKGRYIWEHRMEKSPPDMEQLLPQTIVEIAGHRRVLIENHRGIITYGKEKIIIKVKYGSLSVCGQGMEILHMSKEQLVISGTICNVTLHRREIS